MTNELTVPRMGKTDCGEPPLLLWGSCMGEDRFDLVILGGGSAGFAAAIKASGLGAKTAMVESRTLGGTCVNVGCVPSKNLLSAGELLYYALNHGFKGVSLAQRSFDFNAVIEAKTRLVRGLRRRKYAKVLRALPNVVLLKGQARFKSNREVFVGERTLRGERFIVATGSSPRIVPFEGIGKVEYLTSDEALSLRKLPDSMLIIGGRALALEFAQMYAHFGTKVTLLQRSPRIIPDEEPEISGALRGYLEEEGIEIHTGVTVKSAAQRGQEKAVIALVKGRRREFSAEQLLMATGRKPNTEGLALEQAGVEMAESGAVKVNEEMRTTASNVWAAGDVIGEPMLETAAAKEGAVAAENALTGSHRKVDFLSIPRAIFTSPQVATVGYTDREANERGYRCACNTVPMSEVPKAEVIGDTHGLVKMVVETETERVLGVHLLAPDAGDLIMEGVYAVKYRLTVDDIIDTVHVFPTLAEAIKLAATSFRADITKLTCCAE